MNRRWRLWPPKQRLAQRSGNWICPIKSPSGANTTTPSSPGPCNHNWAFMMTNVENAVSGNGTADLTMQAPVTAM